MASDATVAALSAPPVDVKKTGDKPAAAEKDRDFRDDQVEHMEKELAFYMSYHSNKINQIIHFIFIPQILWSALIILGTLNLPGFTFIDVAPGLTFRPSVAMILAFCFQMYYVHMDDFVGTTYLPVMTIMYLTSAYLVNHVPEWLPLRTAFTEHPSALPFGLLVHFNGWFWQFLGHFKFEGRAPALTENLVQALVTAPFFVQVEALFALTNWRPELHKRIRNLASQRIVTMNKAKREAGKKVQ